MVNLGGRGWYLVSRVVACLNIISLYLFGGQETIENLVRMWNLNLIIVKCSEL